MILTYFDCILTYQSPVFATEMRHTKHVLEVKPVFKNLYSVEMKQINQSMKDPSKLEIQSESAREIT